MKETNIPSETGVASAQKAPNGLDTKASLTSEQKKIAYRLQDQIDEHGRYADYLKPIASGYAAGSGISEYEAKQEIGRQFEQEIGLSLKSYVENYRQERGLSIDNGRGGRS